MSVVKVEGEVEVLLRRVIEGAAVRAGVGGGRVLSGGEPRGCADGDREGGGGGGATPLQGLGRVQEMGRDATIFWASYAYLLLGDTNMKTVSEEVTAIRWS